MKGNRPNPGPGGDEPGSPTAANPAPDAKRDGHTSGLEIIQSTVGKDLLRLTDGAALERERISRSPIKSRVRERDRLKACYG